MGGAISSLQANVLNLGEGVAGKMAEKQREAMAAQQAFMMQQAKRQQAIMMAQQREQLVWEAGAWALVATATTMRTVVSRRFPAPAAVPLLVLPYLMAYQVDMAYGNKMDRIKAESDRILAEEAHWFTEVKPADSKKKLMTNL
eukprot:Unigene12158_Nuclearia_a/m.36965 Unigene12158_Nuclearia_a/g.36965  ORF Unigene12158_Nuclearia_a/g.36965 Unigene12158_Nuclearia_a/m.36965 type:complete len:143 (-) Unigene12158_Nuclearia_a:65-493(-)